MPLRVFETRKTPTTEPRSIVCLYDDAIDVDAMGQDACDEYMRTFSDGLLIRAAGAGAPTRFDIIPLTHEQHRQIRAKAQREADRDGKLTMSVLTTVLAEEAFRSGCKAIRGVELCADDGATANAGGLPRDRWDEIPPGWRIWIGTAVLSLSTLPTPPEAPAEDLGKS